MRNRITLVFIFSPIVIAILVIYILKKNYVINYKFYIAIVFISLFLSFLNLIIFIMKMTKRGR